MSLNESAMPPEFVARCHAIAHEEYPGDQCITAGWMPGYDVLLEARQHVDPVQQAFVGHDEARNERPGDARVRGGELADLDDRAEIRVELPFFRRLETQRPDRRQKEEPRLLGVGVAVDDR